MGQLFLLLTDGVTLGRIFSQSMKWGHSQHPPYCATLKTGQWTGSASTVLGTQCHPGNGSWLALSSYPSTHNWGWLSVLWLSQHVLLRSLRGPQSSSVALFPGSAWQLQVPPGLSTSWQRPDKGH